MSYWAWWTSGLALSGVAVLHWILSGRQLAVSGRYTAIVNRLRWGAEPEEALSADTAELMAALQAATEAEFGADARDDELDTGARAEAAPEDAARAEVAPEDAGRLASTSAAFATPTVAAPLPWTTHLVFLFALFLGGLVASITHGDFATTAGLRGNAWSELTGGGTLGYATLIVGGVLVGFGTRMAGGCTSGHGLCGVSRFQRGSIAATMAFFGAGVLLSFVLELV